MAVSPATQHIRTALQLLAPNSVVEIRALGVAGRGNRVDSGYFDNPDQAALAVARIDGKADGIYVTLNPCKSALLARAANRLREWSKTTTSDPDIERRKWFLIDADPLRPTNISSTDAEHEAAHNRALAIREWLTLQGWPQPILADSGNGYHLLYPIDLPNDSASAELLKACLEALAFEFDDSTITIDRKVFNAARIGKLYGTMACKGDSTPERPHRRSAIVDTPQSLVVVDVALLKALARRVPQAPKAEHYTPTSGVVSPANIEAWLQSHNLDYKEKAWGNDTIYQLAECPFNSDHGRDSYVVQKADGTLGFGCFHNGCGNNHWREFRAKFDPPKESPQPTFKNGVAHCPAHDTPLVKTKAGDAWRCPEGDRHFWWKGEGYTPPQNTTTANKSTPPRANDKEYVVAPASNWRNQGTTLRELQHKVFEPERWVVEDILPEGACLLAAKYKSKKSWLGLAIGSAVAMGGRALGRRVVSQGRVLYLDLEGKQQRIQKRTRAMLGVQQIDWPDNFHVYTKWPQGDEGFAQLRDWFLEYHDTALVIIDVLADFRRPMDKHDQPYQYDRATVQPLNELFEEFHAAGILVHHFNKAKNDDIMDSISGTTGLPSAVNTMWGLARDPNNPAMTILNLRGRDLENEEPIALRWDDYLHQHIEEGPASVVSISGERKAIVDLLSDDEPRSPTEIAKELGKTADSVKQLLRKLVADQVVDKAVTYGKYTILHKPDHSDHSDHHSHSDHSDHSGASYVQPALGDSNVAQDLNKSDRYTPRVIPPDHRVLGQQEATNSDSDRSDRDWAYTPPNKPAEPATNIDWKFVRMRVKANDMQAIELHCRLRKLNGVRPAPIEEVIRLAKEGATTE